MSQQSFTIDLTVENRGVPIRPGMVEAAIRNMAVREVLLIANLEVIEDEGFEEEG